jgi:uncharacterized protein (TIGR03435 family)
MRFRPIFCLAPLLMVQLFAQSSPDEVRFEVASIKPSKATFGGFYNPMPSRFTTTSSVVEMVRLAYQIPNYRVVAGEPWMTRERFDINATITTPRTPGDFRIMLRNLLADRFALRVHREERVMDVYALTMARADGRLGPDIARVSHPCAKDVAARENRCYSSEGTGTYSSFGGDWGQKIFVDYLERESGRPVIDRTGLSGQFNLTLRFNPQMQRLPESAPGGVTAAELEERPVLFTAVREQLGLKLEPASAPVEVMVIDSAQRPALD